MRESFSFLAVCSITAKYKTYERTRRDRIGRNSGKE